jgi:tetratricopeptide (TPR) repeat protein
MSSRLDRDNLEAEIWEVEQVVKDINKILHGDEKDLKEALEKEKKLEEREKHKKLLAEINAREQYQKLLNGFPGKGEGKNYEKFCPNCFYEYTLKEIDDCTHCHQKLITRDERHKALKQKLEVYKEKQKKKKFRKMKYNNWIKSHGEIKILDASRHGPTNYTKWDMYESDSDEEEKQPILPRHDPNFIALEKSMNADLKKKEESQRKSLKLKEEGNQAFKEKKYRKAINLYSQAIEESRGIMYLYTNRAMAYIQTEEYNKAIEDCDRVIQYYELFEEELNKNVDTYTKSLVRKAKALLAIKDYQEAKDTIDKALEYNEENQEILKFQKEIENSLNLNNKAKEALKKKNDKNDENFNIVNNLIVELKKRLYDKEVVRKQELMDIFDKVKNIFEKENKKLAATTKDNNYILFFSVSGGIETLFNYLKSQANNDSDILTKILELLLVINLNPKYLTLINECKGYNKLIEFLFKTESEDNSEKKSEKKLAINLKQADIILTLLEKATLDDS